MAKKRKKQRNNKEATKIDLTRKPLFNRPVWVDFLVIVGVILFFSGGWLVSKGCPGGDLAAGIPHLWYIKKVLCELKSIPYWFPEWFCGSSAVLIIKDLLVLLIILPVTFLFNYITASKIVIILFHILASISMYYFVFYLLKDRDASFLAGFIYPILPVYITESSLTSHWAVSLCYTFVPLVFWLYIKALREQERLKNIPIAAISMFLMFWLDSERTLTIIPFLILIFLFESYQNYRTKSERGLRQILSILWEKMTISLVIVGITTGLSLFFLLPGFTELRFHALFSKKGILIGLHKYSFTNLLYLFDRDGVISNALEREYLPITRFGGIGMYYVGTVLAILIIFTLFMHYKIFKEKRFFFFSLLLVAIGIWFSFGAYSVYEKSAFILKNLFSSEDFRQKYLVGIIMAGLIIFSLISLYLYLAYKGKRLILDKKTWIISITLFVAIILFLFFKPFMALRDLVPLYAHMRCPAYFMVIVPYLFICVLSAYSILILKSIIKNINFLRLIAILLVLGIIFDFYPYHKFFKDRTSPEELADLKDIYEYIGKDTDQFRTLGIEVYNPFSDMGMVYSQKPSAWSCLIWSSPKRTCQYLDRACRLLREDSSRAANLLGVANIKYLVDDKLKVPNLAESKYFKLIKESSRFAVFENMRWKPFVQLYSDTGVYIGDASYSQIKWVRRHPENIEIDINTEKPLTLMVSESWYPYWQVYIDEKKENVLCVNHAFLGVNVPSGKHKVIFKYETPAYYLIGYAVSFLTLLIVSIMYFFSLTGVHKRKDNLGR